MNPPRGGLLALLLVKIPFDFRAGQAYFGPGEYAVSVDGTKSSSVTVRDAGGDRSVVVPAKKAGAIAGRSRRRPKRRRSPGPSGSPPSPPSRPSRKTRSPRGDP